MSEHPPPWFTSFYIHSTRPPSRKRKKSRTKTPPCHDTEGEQQEQEERPRPPSPKVSKMRSDMYEESELERRRRGSERRGEVRGGEVHNEGRVHDEVRGGEGRVRDEVRGGEGRVRDEVRGRESRVRSERPSMKRYEAPNFRSMSRKTVRAQVCGCWC